MPYRKYIFSLKDITFHGDMSLRYASFHGDISFEMVMVHFEPLIKIKSWSNGQEWRGIMKDDNSNEEAQVCL